MLQNLSLPSKNFIVNSLKRNTTKTSPKMKFKMWFLDLPRIPQLFHEYSLLCHMETNMNWWMPITIAMTMKVSSLMLSLLEMLPIWQMLWSLSWFKHAGNSWLVCKKFQKYLNKNSPKTGYRLHSKFKWEAKSPG